MQGSEEFAARPNGATSRSQIYAENRLTGLIGDLQTLPANNHRLDASLAQNFVNDLQNSNAGAVDVGEEQYLHRRRRFPCRL